MNPNPINPIYILLHLFGRRYNASQHSVFVKKNISNYPASTILFLYTYKHLGTVFFRLFSVVISGGLTTESTHLIEEKDSLKKTGVPHSSPPNTNYTQNTLQHSNTLFILNCFSSHLNSLIFNMVPFTQVINMAEATKQKKPWKHLGTLLFEFFINCWDVKWIILAFWVETLWFSFERYHLVECPRFFLLHL